MKPLYYIILAFSLFSSGCTKSSDSVKDSNIRQHASFTRLDRIVAQFSDLSPASQHSIVDSLASPLNDYIYLMGASTGNMPASIDSLSHTAAFAMFEPEVNKTFQSADAIERELGTLDANIRELLPKLPQYSYYGIISPYRQQIMLVDSVVYVALNHYLGESHEAYSSMPAYARATKKAGYIPLDIAEAILSVEYPFESSGNPTAVQYLIYQGVLLKMISSLTETDDTATLMGWNAAQLSEVRAQETSIWRKMAAENLIYSTDMQLARRMTEPAPSTALLSADLPGRIGRYIGYQIVNSYLARHPDTNLSDILSSDFYNATSTLIESGYSPK